jgi:hypothetical protein
MFSGDRVQPGVLLMTRGLKASAAGGGLCRRWSRAKGDADSRDSQA